MGGERLALQAEPFLLLMKVPVAAFCRGCLLTECEVTRPRGAGEK